MRGIRGHCDEVVQHLGKCQSVVGLGIREPGLAWEEFSRENTIA